MKNKFPLILTSVLLVSASGLLYMHIQFLPTIKSQQIRTFLQTFITFLYTMCMISYCKSIKIKNNLPATIIPPRIKLYLFLKFNHTLYTQTKKCAKQMNKYKPPRTSHCHVCQCVTRMDHHCPYTNNCLGSRNIKAFILFCLYGGIFAATFLILSFVFYLKLSNNQVATLSQLNIAIWMTLSFVAFLLSLSMNGLAISNIILATKNITQLEMMKGIFRFTDKNQSHPNPYDFGVLANLNNVFSLFMDGGYWLFWWPSEVKSVNDFSQFPMRPIVNNQTIKEIVQCENFSLLNPKYQITKQKLKKIQKQIKKQQENNKVAQNMQQLRKNQQNKYQGVTFFYLGKAYQLTKQQIKSRLAEINDINLQQNDSKMQNEMHQKQDKSNILDLSKDITEEDQQILANIYNQ